MYIIIIPINLLLDVHKNIANFFELFPYKCYKCLKLQCDLIFFGCYSKEINFIYKYLV